MPEPFNPYYLRIHAKNITKVYGTYYYFTRKLRHIMACPNYKTVFE